MRRGRPSLFTLPCAVAACVVALGLPSPAAAQLTEADVSVAEGIVALEDKKYDEALAHFQRALEREPNHIEALYYSGVALMAQDKPAQAVPLLERARQQSPDDVSIVFQLGLAYFALSDYERASPLLEEVFAREPTLDSLGYYVGFLRYRKENYPGALRAFKAGRTTDATIAQLTRFYSGLALAALGLPSQATAEVEQALRLQAASPLTGPAQRLRESFASTRDTARRFHADMRLGVYFDDNVRTIPNPEVGDATVQSLRAHKRESAGNSLYLRLEYDWLRWQEWEASASYSFFTTYNYEIPDFNIIDHLGTLTLKHRGLLAGLPLFSNASVAYDNLMLGGAQLVQRYVGSYSASLIENQGNITSALFKVEVKEFRQPPSTTAAEVQDAVNWLAGFLHIFRFTRDRHLIKLGYQFDLEDAEGADWRYRGHRFIAGGLYTLPWWGIRLGYDAYLHYRDYLDNHSLFPTAHPGTRARQDEEFNHVIRVELPLPNGFVVSADYNGTLARSNLAPFSYDRNIYTLALSWSY